MADKPELSEELQLGTRALESLRELKDWDNIDNIGWCEEADTWVFHCTMCIPEVTDQNLVPAETRWYVHVDPTYPAGQLDLLPAKNGGISHTFPHQRYNGEGDPKVPWRTGKLCLHTDISPLKRYGYEVEPKEPHRRLAWNIQRAKQWLECAARGELLMPGDRFELPDFPTANKIRLAFCETLDSLAGWQQSKAHCGLVRFHTLEGNSETKVVTRFEDGRGNTILAGSDWGEFFSQEGVTESLGVWVRVQNPVILEPWQAPVTWLELTKHLRQQDLELQKVLPGLLERWLRHSGEDRYARPEHPLLVGFPIPERIGERPVRMHWMGFPLPPLAEGSEVANGFRPGTGGHFKKDLQALHRIRSLPWMNSQNWSDEDLTGRGRLPKHLRESRILQIGAGALGSAVAELLVRGGLRSLVVFDGDILEAGNLVRHTLGLRDLGRNKAKALTERLNSASPHAKIRAVGCPFPTVPEEAAESIRGADLVLDCSADDGVLFHLERYDWERERTFISLSLGLHARRLYCFTARGARFPRIRYTKVMTARVEEDWQGIDESTLPRDSIGCWHPLMPACAVDVWLLAAAALKHLSQLDFTRADEHGSLVVFEQSSDACSAQIVRVVRQGTDR